jgi:signal transduction histidine kinase
VVAATPFLRLDRIVRRMALTIGVLTAFAIPTSFGLSAYFDQVAMQRFRTDLAANRVAQYAYVQGRLWRFNEHRIEALMTAPGEDEGDDYRVVYYADGSPVVRAGSPLVGPVSRVRSPILVQNQQQGFVESEVSLAPLFWRLGFLAILGLMLGAAAYLCVHLLPLRALRQTMGELEATQESLSAQVDQTQAALAKAQRETERAALADGAKSAFLANMSHELRTPLNAIIGFSEIMRSMLFGPIDERYRNYAIDIHASGSHLLQIINDVLDLSKIEAGSLSIQVEDVDLADILSACVRLMRQRAAAAGIDLKVSPGPELHCIVRADPLHVKQVLLNLMSNAVKFTKSGGTVRLSTYLGAAGMWAIEVADTGVGMTEAEVGRAFEPFRQVDNSLGRKQEGTGLGLPLAKRLTELQGGSLRLVSRSGTGTTATIFLPAASVATVHGPGANSNAVKFAATSANP